ncbi:Peptidoglycan/LPS O-acetylase OafA/YrhL, contains acyltransferase and SGNH-hydrolase domains [Ruminococcaceae bacterium KH2T8]|nr:Peptidoglycan/LPS O-acetylase OafA/YrhL, contains acyltransferase and SGNH-hydrolase domains [Ruminococcaceae bacterium KH2T8]
MNFTVIFYISLALLGALLLINAKRRPSDEKTFFDRILSKEIRGFLAIFIIFHQTVITMVNFGVREELMKEFMNYYYYGILAVAFFFFSSGFGLVKRWLTDKDYTKGFMKRRIFTVLVPYFICNYIYLTEALLGNIRYGNHFTFTEVICAFFGLFLVNNQMWFAVEIMILYVAFRIIFGKVKKAGTGIILTTAVVLIMVTIGLLSGHSQSMIMSYWFKGEWWYNTILMFPVGMLYAYKEEKVNRVIRKAFTAIILSSSVLFVLLDYIHRGLVERQIYYIDDRNNLQGILYRLEGLSEETVLELVFIILVITIVSKVRIGNAVLKFMGKISLETIMLNYLMIENLFFIYDKYGIGVYLPAVLVSTIVVAAVVYLIKNMVLERRSGLFDGDVR